MSTKNARRKAALDRAKAESTSRWPDGSARSRWLRIGFVAGVMWHREHPWHTPAADVEIRRHDAEHTKAPDG